MYGYRAHRSCQGFAAIYTLVILVALTGICSLAVDVGRVQLAKTELRRAVDAAALAGASGLLIDQSTARSRAASIAAANTYDIDAKPLVLDTASEVTFVSWNSQPAIRVAVQRQIPLILAGVIGRSSCRVTASAAACVIPNGSSYGIVGLNSITVAGNASVDSYDASVGPYSMGNRSEHGDIASNGSISLSGNVTIYGNARYGTTKSTAGNARVHSPGVWIQESSDLSYPAPTAPSSYEVDLGTVNRSGNGTMTLTAGTYHATSFSTAGNFTLNVTGPVTLYVDNSVSLAGNVSIAGNLPSNFKLRVMGSGSVSLSGNSALYADVYAPQSAISTSGNGAIYGALIGRSLSIAGNGTIHFDTSLGYGNSPGTLALVQ